MRDRILSANNEDGANLREYATTGFFYLVALCLIGVGFCAAFGVRGVKPEGGKIALYLFSAAAGVMLAREFIYLLPNLIELTLGGVTVKLQNKVEKLEEKVVALKTDVRQAQGGTSAKEEQAKLDALGRERKEVENDS